MQNKKKYVMLDGSFKIGTVVETSGILEVKWVRLVDHFGNIIDINMDHVMFIIEYTDDYYEEKE